MLVGVRIPNPCESVFHCTNSNHLFSPSPKRFAYPLVSAFSNFSRSLSDTRKPVTDSPTRGELTVSFSRTALVYLFLLIANTQARTIGGRIVSFSGPKNCANDNWNRKFACKRHA
ncbi:hypothetical protein Trydic_g23785 [Trypoxylus dichotomus]